MNINKPKRPWKYYYNQFMHINAEKLQKGIDEHMIIIAQDAAYNMCLENFKKFGDWTWKDTGIPLKDLVNECE